MSSPDELKPDEQASEMDPAKFAAGIVAVVCLMLLHAYTSSLTGDVSRIVGFVFMWFREILLLVFVGILLIAFCWIRLIQFIRKVFRRNGPTV